MHASWKHWLELLEEEIGKVKVESEVGAIKKVQIAEPQEPLDSGIVSSGIDRMGKGRAKAEKYGNSTESEDNSVSLTFRF